MELLLLVLPSLLCAATGTWVRPLLEVGRAVVHLLGGRRGGFHGQLCPSVWVQSPAQTLRCLQSAVLHGRRMLGSRSVFCAAADAALFAVLLPDSPVPQPHGHVTPETTAGCASAS